MPSLSRARACAGGGGAAGPDVGREPEDRLGGGVGALGDQPGRGTAAVDLEVAAVLGRAPAGRSRRPRGPCAAEEGARTRGRRAGTRRTPRRAPRSCGRASRTRRCRTGPGSSFGLGARVQGAVGLHPEHHVAGVRAGGGLQVGQAAQHLERRVRGSTRSRSASSRGGRRRRRGPCRRRCRRPGPRCSWPRRTSRRRRARTCRPDGCRRRSTACRAAGRSASWYVVWPSCAGGRDGVAEVVEVGEVRQPARRRRAAGCTRGGRRGAGAGGDGELRCSRRARRTPRRSRRPRGGCAS